MNIHYLKHVPFEGLGSMQGQLVEQGHHITLTNLYLGETLPSPESIDALIIMGGPMGVYDEKDYPWLKDEKHFIGEVIHQYTPVLGICLGAQLIADVLGGKVSKNAHREIGWFDVSCSPAFSNTRFGRVLPKAFEALHWHGDTFSIPSDAVALGSSDACPNQGFVYKEHVLALQFHLEMTEETVTRLIKNCANELDGSTYVQDGPTLLADRQKFSANNALMAKVINEFLN